MNHVTSQGLTPRMRPLSSRKSATLSILDIGTSKVVCLIAELSPAETNERLRGRTQGSIQAGRAQIAATG